MRRIGILARDLCHESVDARCHCSNGLWWQPIDAKPHLPWRKTETKNMYIYIYIYLTRVTEEGFGFGTSFMDLIMIYWENRFFFTVSHIFKLDSLHLKYRFSEFSKQFFQLWASALPIWRAAMVYWPWYWSVRGVGCTAAKLRFRKALGCHAT